MFGCSPDLQSLFFETWSCPNPNQEANLTQPDYKLLQCKIENEPKELQSCNMKKGLSMVYRKNKFRVQQSCLWN